MRRELGVELVIHYDPIVTDDEELTRIHARVAEILKGVDPQLAVHDFRMVRGSRHTNVIFDMVLPFSMESRKQELRELVERELQTDGKQYHAVITLSLIHSSIKSARRSVRQSSGWTIRSATRSFCT